MRPQFDFWGDWARNRPGERAPVIRRNGGNTELVELHWGLKPRDPEQRPLINIRSERRHFPSHRCLATGGEFFFSTHFGSRRECWRFTLADNEDFYFAGIWRPASEDWPESYAVLTTPANPDISPYNDRQMDRHSQRRPLCLARPDPARRGAAASAPSWQLQGGAGGEAISRAEEEGVGFGTSVQRPASSGRRHTPMRRAHPPAQRRRPYFTDPTGGRLQQRRVDINAARGAAAH